MPAVLIMLLAGLTLVILGVVMNRFTASVRGIWPAGLGTVLTCLAIFSLAGYNDTAFYPSKTDLNSSLTIYNASSSHYTLTMMRNTSYSIHYTKLYENRITSAGLTRQSEASHFSSVTLVIGSQLFRRQFFPVHLSPDPRDVSQHEGDRNRDVRHHGQGVVAA